jgi:hypothetical protein
MVRAMLFDHGVEVHEDGVALACHLRKIGIKAGVVSASNDCRSVLEAVGIQELFETRLDGEVSDLWFFPANRLRRNFWKPLSNWLLPRIVQFL